MQTATIPILLLFLGAGVGLAIVLLLLGRAFSPSRAGRVKLMPYESGMDPIHDTRRRFDVRFHLMAIAFLVFDVELLFLYPWAVALRDQTDVASPAAPAHDRTLAPSPDSPQRDTASRPAVRPLFVGGMVFLVLLTLGLVYDWRKGVFRWR